MNPTTFRARYIDVEVVESRPNSVTLDVGAGELLHMSLDVFTELYVPVYDAGVSEIGGEI